MNTTVWLVLGASDPVSRASFPSPSDQPPQATLIHEPSSLEEVRGAAAPWRPRVAYSTWSARGAQSAHSGTIAGRLEDASVLDLEGHEVALRTLYENGPVAIVWLRHYG